MSDGIEILGDNPLTLAEDHARRMLASSGTFQSLGGCSDATEALARIFIDAPFDPENGEEYNADHLIDLAPFAIVSSLGENALVFDANGVGSYDEGGTVSVELWIAAKGESDRVVLRRAKNAIGRILSEIAEKGETPGYLARPTIRLLGIVRTSETDRLELGDFVIASCEFGWGSLRAGGD